MSPPFPKASTHRRPLAAAHDAATPATFAGRLRRSGPAAWLIDASATRRLLEAPDTLPNGAIIEVDAAWDAAAGALRAARSRLLVAPLTPAHAAGAGHNVPSLDALQARHTMNRAVRAVFEERGFWEVETPALVPTPGTDVYLEAFATRFSGLGAWPAADLYLHTSPEFAMKRLLVAGAEKIYQLCRCYRDSELTSRHNPEFTMVEWYRAYADADPIQQDVEDLIRAVIGADTLTVGAVTIDLAAPFERLTVQDAFARYAGGIDLLATRDADDLRAAAVAAGLPPLILGGGWDDLFHELLVTHVEPRLGYDRPVFLTDYPAPLAVLARRSDHDPRVAERFELYIAGVELCNGFSELNDPVEQRARFQEDQARRAAAGRTAYPMPDALLAALEAGMPPSGGVALGLDRLLMLKTGAEDIGEVLLRSLLC